MAGPRKPGIFKRFTEALFEEIEQPVAPVEPPEPDPLEEKFAKPTERKAVDFDDLKPAPAPPPPITQEKIHTAREISVATADFQERVNKVLEGEGTAVAGRMQFLNMEEIRKHFGDKWESMAEKAYSIAEQVINHRLAPTDVCAPYDDDSYILLFAELTEEQARLKAASISREIRERLLGELGIDDRNWAKAFVGDIKTLVPVKPGETITIEQIGQQLAKTEDIAPPPLSQADAELQRKVGEVGICYRPTWYAPKKVISIFDTRAVRLDRLNKLYSGAHAYGKVDAPIAFEIDRLVLTRSIRDIRKLAAADGRALVVIPLHIQSLITHSGNQLVDLLRMQPPEIRHLLVIELAGPPPTLLSHSFEAISLVQPFCRAITVRVPLGFVDIDRFARQGIISVGIDLDTPENMGRPLDQIVEQLDQFVKRAHQKKITSHVYGITTKEMFKAVRGLGFDYLNGPAIAHEVGKPAKAFGYEPAP
jgi:hypothetical protein